jgi:hypothetical protein
MSFSTVLLLVHLSSSFALEGDNYTLYTFFSGKKLLPRVLLLGTP